MEFLRPGPHRSEAELRALTDVGRSAHAGLEQPQRAVLDALQKLLFETDFEADALPSISPEELAVGAPGRAQNRQLVRLMAIVAVAAGPPSEAQMNLISSYARALGVKEPAVRVLRHLARGQRRRFRIAFFRHSHLRTYLGNSKRMLGGWGPLLKALRVMRGLSAEDSESIARFRALGELPDGTLGRAFFEHYIEAGLRFPGERGGFPVGALYHDFSHVLSGYDTSPEGEMKNAAFQAGFTRHIEDDFFVLLFALLTHTAGVDLTPFDMPVMPGRIGRGDLAFEVVRALQRGSDTQTNLADNWNSWPYVELALDDARAALGVAASR